MKSCVVHHNVTSKSYPTNSTSLFRPMEKRRIVGNRRLASCFPDVPLTARRLLRCRSCYLWDDKEYPRECAWDGSCASARLADPHVGVGDRNEYLHLPGWAVEGRRRRAECQATYNLAILAGGKVA